MAGSLSHTNPQLDCEFFIKFSLQLSLHSSVSVSDETVIISDDSNIISDDTTPWGLSTNYKLILIELMN